MANGEYELHSRLARVEQRVSDLDQRMIELANIVPTVIRMSEQVSTMHRDLGAYAAELRKLDDEIDNRETVSRRERREARRWMVGTAIVLIGSLVSLAGVILTHGVH